MLTIEAQQVNEVLEKFAEQPMYVHLETTTGAYAAHYGKAPMTVCALLRNLEITYAYGALKGVGPFRAALKTPTGWIYAEGLTHMKIWEHGINLTGLDANNRLTICLQLSTKSLDSGMEDDWS
ncbi:MAG: DUF1806 family protein [Bacilli bacterium]